MMLKRLRLRNIRSYKDADVEFPKGVILFEGDIGSGKSSLLVAIEFALFGFSNVKPKYLLRHGEKEGMGEVTLEVDGKEYVIHREIDLKGMSKRKGANFIMENGSKIADFSVEEMKALVLDILGFNEPKDPKSSSVIYRYAVFTPQEEMKTILEQRPEDRLQTIRRAFHIDEFKVARDNADTLRLMSDRAVRRLDEFRKGLGEREERLRALVAEQKGIEEDLEKIDEGRVETEANIRFLESRLKHMNKKKEEMDAAEKAIIFLKGQVERASGSLEQAVEAAAEQNKAERELGALAPKLKDLRALRDEESRLRKELERFSEGGMKLGVVNEKLRSKMEEQERDAKDVSAISAYEEKKALLEKQMDPLPEMRERRKEQMELAAAKNQESETLKKELGRHKSELKGYRDLTGEARCPKCKQPMDEEHLSGLIEEVEEYIEELRKDQKRAIEGSESAASKARKLEKDIAIIEELKYDMSDAERTIEDLKKVRTRMEAREKDIIALNGEKVLLEKHVREGKDAEKRLATVTKRMEKLSDVEARHAAVEQSVKDLGKRSRDVGSLKEELDQARKELVGKEKEVKDIQKDFSRDRLDETNAKYIQEREARTGFEKQLLEKKHFLERLTRDAAEFEKDITERRAKVAVRDRMADLGAWFSGFYIPALADIERDVLCGLNEEFEERFREWFGILMETDEIAVRLDENFTPMIEQNGYEVPHAHLSGGERTSVAFAYRLAMNALVRENMSSMRENMIILDEPTDGFSKEQLNRMRDVLEALGCDQTIIVSHEKELEGFADHIFRVVKQDGSSSVHAR